MTSLSDIPDLPGLRLRATDLLALRAEAVVGLGHRPATRRPGAVPARRPGAGLDLREIRAYVPGDDARRIDPAATARTGQPHVRAFHEDRDDTTLLIADFRAPMLWGTGDSLRSVRGARHLARLGWQAVARGGTVAALAVTGAGMAELRPGGGDRHMAAIAAMFAAEHDIGLTRAGPPPAASATGSPAGLGAALARAARLAPAGGRVILATAPGAMGDRADAALARLARRRRVTVALVIDPLERSAPAFALPVSDGQTTRHQRLMPPDLAAGLARLRALGADVDEIAT